MMLTLTPPTETEFSPPNISTADMYTALIILSITYATVIHSVQC